MPSYDANNRLTSETKDNVTTTYTYDNNGNNISKSCGTTLDVYSYNLYNQLTGNVINNVNATYTYNAKGIRTSKTVGTDVTSFILDGGNVVAEVKGTAVTDYVRGINLICTDESYYIYNAHGDVVSLTSISGVVTKTYDYDAFGNETNPSSTDTNPFRYCGEYYDTETGTYYLRARYYDPAVGRFGTEDPVHDGLNWYTYCAGNPILFVDPSGYQRVAGYYTINGKYGWYDDPDAEEFRIDSDTYKIIDDLGKRWWATEDQAERDRLHEMAEAARNAWREKREFNYGQETVTALLRENAQEGIEYQELYKKMSQIKSRGSRITEPYVWFVLMTCTDWNYKYNEEWRVPEEYMKNKNKEGETIYYNGFNMNEKNSRNWVPWIYFEGELWGADKIGNINLGYVGTAMGYGGVAIKNFATMDKDDAPAVLLGIELAKKWR